MATLVTGITPQQALAEGISESQAFDRINELMSRPGTCALGYNTLRFDDEFVRYGLFPSMTHTNASGATAIRAGTCWTCCG